MNLTIMISVLDGGGAARVAVNLANYFCSIEGVNVNVLSHRRECAYFLDERVRRSVVYEDFEMRSSIWNKVHRRLVYWNRFVRLLRESQPDVVVSFLRGMNWRAILACRLLGIKVIATEHLNHLEERGFWSWVEAHWIYKLADHVTVLTNFDFRAYYGRFLNSVHVVPNPLSFPIFHGCCRRSKTILSAGDLDRWSHKGFDNLIRMFAHVHAEFPDWRLRIAGRGEAGKTFLESLAKDLGVEHKVDFLGMVSDLDREMRGASIFAVSSRYEGFSMVLIEAMSQGCACISFDCISGPGEILTNENSGLLIADQDLGAFEHGLRRLMKDVTLRERLGGAAKKEVERFDMRNIGELWMALFSR